MIIEVENGLLVKVPDGIKKPIISNWSDGTTTLEFYSDVYEMEYDSFEFNVDKQRKEITLPKKGEYKIIKRIPIKFVNLIDNNKYLYLKQIK